jgi:hypothetical protein
MILGLAAAAVALGLAGWIVWAAIADSLDDFDSDLHDF